MKLKWFRSRWLWVSDKKDCDTCGGTGEVHSHNPSCWSCGGTGRTLRDASALDVDAEVLAGRAFIPDEWAKKELDRLRGVTK